MAIAIRFENVSKQYRLGAGKTSLRERLANAASGLVRGYHSDGNGQILWALRDVSFEVQAGEALGIVGPNGAGKTTILKLLSKVSYPDSGLIETKGRLTALIELGAGFHPDLTGRENVYLNAAILGLSEREIRKRFDRIVEFSELERFIDTPVKRYSSGMNARLGFSVAAHVDPEILLVDEVLSVGDPSFQARCFKRIREMRESGVTMIVVSQQRTTIERNCTRAILLDHGQVIDEGDPAEISARYFTAAHQSRMERSELTPDNSHAQVIKITQVLVCDASGKRQGVFSSGDGMTVEIHFRVNEPVVNPVFYSRLYNSEELVHGTNTARHKIDGSFQAGDTGIARITYLSLNLLEGVYDLTVGVASDDTSFMPFHHIGVAQTIQVTSGLLHGAGTAFLPHAWALEKCESAAEKREYPVTT